MNITGLAFGAFDFVVTPDNEWVVLECNPEGQWGWIEENTGLPIADAIAKYLLTRTE
jgi:D-alanine-D-alanine ligase-like ATP-grasp enzyme